MTTTPRYEIELDYGDEGPGESEEVPSPDEIATAVRTGLEAQGFSPVDVTAKRLD